MYNSTHTHTHTQYTHTNTHTHTILHKPALCARDNQLASQTQVLSSVVTGNCDEVCTAAYNNIVNLAPCSAVNTKVHSRQGGLSMDL